MNNENTTMQAEETQSNVAVIEQTEEKQTVQATKKEKKAKSVKSEKKAKSVKSEKIEQTEEKQTEQTTQATSVQRHKDTAQFEKVLLFILKQDARKSVSVATIKTELEKQIETYRFSVYLWEIRKHVGEVLEKIKEKKTVVALRMIDKQKAVKYMKERFPEMKF